MNMSSLMVLVKLVKGTGMVVIDKQDYNSKALDLLDDKDTYRPLTKDPTPKHKSQLVNLLKSCKTWGQINQHTYKNFIPPVPPPPNFKAGPKSTKQIWL